MTYCSLLPAAAAMLLSAGSALAQSAFRILSPIGTDTSVSIRSVSPDGTTVLGSSGASNLDAATWSTANGAGTRRALSPAVAGRPYTQAVAASTSASVLGLNVLNGSFNPVPYRVQGASRLAIPTLPGATFAYTEGVSASGDVFAGWSDRTGGTQTMWRWSAATGTQAVPIPAGYSTANSGLQVTRCLSGDGNVVIGYVAAGDSRAFSFNAATGVLTLLPLLPNTAPGLNQANSISFDGSVIVGEASADVGGALDSVAVRWTSSGAEQLIPGSAGLGWRARIVSGDGRTIIGKRLSSGSPSNFIWRDGVVGSIESLMTELGLSTSGLTDIDPKDVSFDGTVIVGRVRANGLSRGFALVIPPIPAVCLADLAGGTDIGLPAGGQDGSVDGTDFIAFINSFAIGSVAVDPTADVAGGTNTGRPAGGPDGTIDGTDFIAFINAFAAGC